MRFTTKTEYGLVCMIQMARHAGKNRLTIKQIAEKEGYPPAYIEKILQALRLAGFVEGYQGSGGGYTLAKSPSEITLKQIIDALEGGTFEIFCEPEVRDNMVCTHFCLCGLKPVWRKTKQILDEFYESVTLEMISRDEMAVQKMIGMPGPRIKGSV